VSNLLAFADIRINGTRPWDIQVHDRRFFSRALASGTLGFGESYMDGWWDCDALDEMSRSNAGVSPPRRVNWFFRPRRGDD
jgi:cyclopropane-fatty-acyl-phospholipid synthase